MLITHQYGNMDTQSLQTFLSLCETENMRDTAALERVNQSNVSRSLRRLEAEVGAELFHRHGRRLQLNRHGRMFREHAARAVADLATGRRRIIEEVSAEHGVVHLGFMQSLARELVPDILRRYGRAVPGCRFELRQGFARELYAAMQQDNLDAAVTTPPRSADPRIGFTPLLEQQLCLAVPPGHRLVGETSPTLAAVADEPFIAFNLTTDLRQMIDRLFADAGLEPRTACESGEIDTIRGLIGAGLGVGVLPRPAVIEHDDPVYLDLSPARTRTIGLAWNAASPATPAAARFIDYLSRPDGRPGR
jgi:DNA-binding transcriptional LysR family regulator